MEIPASVIDQMVKAARLAWPNEACGLLAGPVDGDGPRDFWPMDNVSDHPRYRYAIDDDKLLAAWRAIEGGGHRVFAIFHSHTEGDARLSPEDLRHALRPDVWHFVVALRLAGSRPSWALWQANDGMAIEQPVTVIP